MFYIGLDVGTTRCKASVFDANGNSLLAASRDYSYKSIYPGWAEQDVNEVWEKVKEILNELSHGISIRPSALSISSQGEAVIFLNEKGEALRPVILGMDMRAFKECEEIAQVFSYKELLKIGGVPLHPITTLSKILWVKKNQPDIFNIASNIMCYEDFIIWKLCGEAFIDYSMACKTLMFNSKKKSWHSPLIDFLEISSVKLSKCVPSGQIIGKIKPKIANELSLPKDLKIISGGHDQCCAALGSGAIKSDIAFDNVGTAEVFGILTTNQNTAFSINPPNFSCYDHVLLDKYLLTTINQTAGLLLKWYRDNLGKELYKNKILGKNSYEVLVSKARKKPASIFVLPHLVGSGTPWINVKSKAAIIGITLNSDESEIIRAILESIVFELMINLELFKKKEINFKEIRTTGGCSSSPFWLQIRADILGKPLKTLLFKDASVLGAAMLAAYGDKAFPSFEEAVKKMVKTKELYEPKEDLHLFYKDRFIVYKEIYPSLIKIHSRI